MFIAAAFCAVMIAIDGGFMLIDPGLYRRCFEFLDELVGAAWLPLYGFAFCVMGSVLVLSLGYLGAPGIYGSAGAVLIVCGLVIMLSRAERLSFFALWWAGRPSWLYRLSGLILIILAAMVIQALAEL